MGGGEGTERALAVLKEPLHVKVELHNYQIFLNFFLEQFNVSYNGGVFLLFFFLLFIFFFCFFFFFFFYQRRVSMGASF